MIKNVKDILTKLQPFDFSVWLNGASGTGKTVMAQRIHNESARRAKPFQVLNCAALAPDLIDSQLFGYVKGAFTGALYDKKGIIELADNGTLFLDEVLDLPYAAQAKLLRVVETGLLRRIGDKEERKVNVRYIAASCLDSTKAIESKTFRHDLYYRLAQVSITLPDLSQRKDEILPLAQAYLDTLNAQYNGHCTLGNGDYLLDLDYTDGNIRALHSVIRGEYMAQFPCLPLFF